nr:energy transducer TonB [Mucilaginibacter sp. L294]
MKRLIFFSLLILLATITRATATLNVDTTKSTAVFTAIEHPPQYPGGVAAFNKHITENLKYPDVARLIGVNGRIVLTFVIDRDGKVVEVTPTNCIGAGCESEAVKVLQSLKTWQPGIQKGKPVRVQYSVPISFSIGNGKVTFNDLRASKYGFVFKIRDVLYTIDEAQNILGKSFLSDQVEIAEPFYNTDSDPKFMMPNKKEIYIVKMKAG